MTLLVVETLENLFMYLLPSDWAVISCIKWMSFAPYVAQAVKSSFFFFFFFFFPFSFESGVFGHSHKVETELKLGLKDNIS